LILNPLEYKKKLRANYKKQSKQSESKQNSTAIKWNANGKWEKYIINLKCRKKLVKYLNKLNNIECFTTIYIQETKYNKRITLKKQNNKQK